MSNEYSAASAAKPLHVMVAYGPLGLVRATAYELRYDGMMVDTGAVTLDEQAEVEISFTHKRHDEYITHRITALVAASFSGCANLEFRSYARTTLQLLRQLIEGESRKAFGNIKEIPHLPAALWPARAVPAIVPPCSRI